MGLQTNLRINLADPAGFSAVQRVASYQYLGANLSPDTDQSYSLGSGVATLQFSADGENFTNSAKTLSASTTGIFNVDVRGVHSVRFLNTTADASADPSAIISVYLQ